jgi:hypothetical protein
MKSLRALIWPSVHSAVPQPASRSGSCCCTFVRSAVEPVIDHIKAEHRMDRNHLKGRDGDRINAVLAAAGYNFSLLLRWLAELLRVRITMLNLS